VLAQVDTFFTVQLASGAEPVAVPEDAAAADFPANMLVCD